MVVYVYMLHIQCMRVYVCVCMQQPRCDAAAASREHAPDHHAYTHDEHSRDITISRTCTYIYVCDACVRARTHVRVMHLYDVL